MVKKYFLYIPLLAICLIIHGSGSLWASKGNYGLSQTDIANRETLTSNGKTTPPPKKVLLPAARLPLKQFLINGPPSANLLITGVLNAFRPRYPGPEVSPEQLRSPLLMDLEGSSKNSALLRQAQPGKDVQSIKPSYVLTPEEIKMLRDRFGCQQAVFPGQNLLTNSNQCSYIFPVAAPFTFRDSWGEPRSGGRHHLGVDIYAQEGTEVYAITAGVIHTLATWPEAGITILLQGRDGKGYGYMHLQRYAEGLVEGKAVKKGELIGYLGRTGIVESKGHLHFQAYPNHHFCKEELQDAYEGLVQLCGGVGVTDLKQSKVARRQMQENRRKVAGRQIQETGPKVDGLQIQDSRSKVAVWQIPESRLKVAGPQFKKTSRIIGGIQIQETGNKIIIKGFPGSVTLRGRGIQPGVKLFNGKEELM
jgi:murein DD-endopeptidase MepM/ murein hydrolase activator NlpD